MLGQVICPKYLDPGSPIVDVHIDGIVIPHTLINLGFAINVMTKDTMLKLNLQGSLRKTTIVLQLVDRTTVTPDGIVEDVTVSIDSWEYPADFLVEVTNRALEGILAKVVNSSRKDWADRLVEATWAYNTTWKTTIGFTPYEPVYGKKAMLSIEFEYNTLRMAAQLYLDLSHAQKERLLQLNRLDEQRLQALLHSEVVQLQRKIWHDRHLKEKQF
eukprot:PITA_27325